MFIEAAIIAALVGLGPATGVHHTRDFVVDTTADITEEEFEKSMKEFEQLEDRSLSGPRKRLN
ncbi:MAG: hypothetical protein LBI70_00595 [Rickettsiales bacterium]|jgi:hypothetical protein|nr:hypothetical protein [Rickettsiales bacterium]